MMSHDVPRFPTLIKNYPNIRDSEMVKRLIGGEVGKTVGVAGYENTCTIRISKDLNYSGVLIPGHVHGLSTMVGKDKFHYAFRVREMRRYLLQKFGEPDVVVTGPPVSRDEFKAVKGIIAFEIHFGDATGHFDLWDGHTFFDEIYGLSTPDDDFFKRANRVSVWKADGEGTLPQPTS